MRYYFHSNTDRYIKIRRYILFISLLPLIQGSVICGLILIINLRAFYEQGYHLVFIYALTAAGVLGTLIFYCVFWLTERAVRKHARYTYFEITGKTLVFSKYAGVYIKNGKTVTERVLYVLPLADLRGIGFNRRTRSVFLVGDIRRYTDNTERLRYILTEDGIEFGGENWWYNENGYTSLEAVKVADIFGGGAKLKESITAAKREFDAAPTRKPYVHKTHERRGKQEVIETLKALTMR